jgi:hypothetical protein
LYWYYSIIYVLRFRLILILGGGSESGNPLECMKQIKDLKPVLHLKKDNYIYRYVLVDRFQNDGKNHYGFDTKQEKTTEEIFALKSNRQIRRKYIIRK